MTTQTDSWIRTVEVISGTAYINGIPVHAEEGYCPHGSYTGGCGVDWMCGACEMGELSPSPSDFRTSITKLAAKQSREALKLTFRMWQWGLDGDNAAYILEHHSSKTLSTLRSALTQAIDLDVPDDVEGWWEEAYDAASNALHKYWSKRDDKYSHLPSHVLDGGY